MLSGPKPECLGTGPVQEGSAESHLDFLAFHWSTEVRRVHIIYCITILKPWYKSTYCQWYAASACMDMQVQAFMHMHITPHHTCMHLPCIHIYAHMRIRILAYIHMCRITYIHTYIHAYKQVYIHTCMYAYVHVHVCRHSCIHACIHLSMHACICSYIPTYGMPTYLHTQPMYISTYIADVTPIHARMHPFVCACIFMRMWLGGCSRLHTQTVHASMRGRVYLQRWTCTDRQRLKLATQD